jgi:tetratricopeptide (TPR) repeat protein
MTVHQFLRRRPPRTDRYGRALPVLASIDQAEDLFRGDSGYYLALIEELKEALDGDNRLRLLLSIREDHFNDLSTYDHIFDIESAALLHLKPLEPQAAVAAIRRPIESTGHSFESAAAEALIEDLRSVPGTAGTDSSSAVEPTLLQVACSGIWESLPESQQFITVDQIRSSAGVSRSLTDFVSQVLHEIAAEYEVSAPELHSWMLATFDTDNSVEEGPVQTAGMPNSIVGRLQDRHLLKAEWKSGIRSFQLQHDRLIEPLRSANISSFIQFSPEASMLAAKRALNEEDFERAEHHVQRIVRSEQEIDIRLRAEAESIIGNIAYARGMQKDAADHYRNAAALFEVVQDAQAVGLLLAALGRTGMIQGHHLEAMDAMQSAVERIPTDSGIQTALAQVLWEMGKSNPALAVLDQVLSANGDTPEALRVRAEIMAAMGNTTDALRDRDRVHMDQAPRTRAARALALAAAREQNAAEREIGSALDEAPDNGPVLFYAAQIQILRGDNTTAADLARRAIAAEHPPLTPRQREHAQRLLDKEPG